MKKIIFLAALALSIPFFAIAHGDGEEVHIIRMTDNGFEPKELALVEGDEVVFINDDDVDRWPASNLHPTHGIYPEFDPLKGLKPGDSWSFIFDKPGTWRMHDHLIPSMTGTITVLEGEGAYETDENESEEEGFLEKFLSSLKAFFNRLFGRG